jgi:hypothetical protein
MAILSPQDAFFTAFEPIQKNRFQVTVDGFPTFLIKSINVPTPESNEVVIDHINVDFKVKGRTRFKDWSMVVYNSIVPSTMEIIYEWERLGHEVYGRDGYSDFYKRDMTVEILDPTLAVVSRFVIKGAWIKTIGGVEFDKTGEGLVDISVGGACDYCILEF